MYGRFRELMNQFIWENLRVGSDAGFGIDKDCIVAPKCLAQRRPLKIGMEVPRLPRLQYENAIYHVVTRGDGRRRLFQDEGH